MILRDFGEILSGRSKGSEVAIRCVQTHTAPPSSLHFDFKGVRSFTQSFVSGLLTELHRREVKLSAITFEGIDQEELIQRFEREKDRLSVLYGDESKAS